MTVAQARHGNDSIYFDAANGRYVGAVSLGRDAGGKRVRRKVTGRTKTEVRRKLRTLRQEIAEGTQSSGRYTVERAVTDWLKEGLDGRSAQTVQLYTTLLQPVIKAIGAKPLKDLSAHDVRALLVKTAEDHSTRTVQIVRNCLERAVTHAEMNGHVMRNVVTPVKAPTGQTGRPSKALTAEQAGALLMAAKASRLHAYVALCMQTGVRNQEARALTWEHLDLDAGTVAVWRSVRASGDTKTPKSRRTLKLPQAVVEALRAHRVQQAEDRLKAGELWQDNDLVFPTSLGTMQDRHNVLREFRKVTKAAGLNEDWTPRELRHTFVSILSESGVPLEEIARLAGHSTTRTTELVYRRELRPVITTGAEVMDRVFSPALGAPGKPATST